MMMRLTAYREGCQTPEPGDTLIDSGAITGAIECESAWGDKYVKIFTSGGVFFQVIDAKRLVLRDIIMARDEWVHL